MTMIGNLGNDAVIRDSGNKKAVSFSVAHSEKYTDRNGSQVEKTIWVRCTYWRDADKTKIAEYLKKGQKVYVEGTPSARSYQNKNNETVTDLELTVFSLELLGSKEVGGTTSQPKESHPEQNPQPVESERGNEGNGSVDDDLPF